MKIMLKVHLIAMYVPYLYRQRYFPVCFIETVMINVAFGRFGKSAFVWLCRGAARSKYLLFLNTVNRLLHWFFHVIEWINDNCTYMYTRVTKSLIWINVWSVFSCTFKMQFLWSFQMLMTIQNDTKVAIVLIIM